jgi:hypothetical protein
LTPAFLRAVSRSETLPEAKTMLRRLNARRPPEQQLMFFSYESRHLGTPDNPDSFRRLLIVVPGNATTMVPEKWVQFGITDPGYRARVRNVSVVAVVPALDGTTNAYFKDYFRTFGGNGAITIKGRWELGGGDDNCTQCHKSGILPIFPEAGSVSRDEQASVEKVNQRFLDYGRRALISIWMRASWDRVGLKDSEGIFRQRSAVRRVPPAQQVGIVKLANGPRVD